MTRITKTVATMCLALALGACERGRDETKKDVAIEQETDDTVPAQTTRTPTESPRDTTTPTTPATPKADDPTDAQIVALATAGHQSEIDLAKVALSKTKNPEIKALAEMMVKDHSAGIDKAKELTGKLGMTPDESGEHLRMAKDQASETRSRLEAMSDAELDKAYVDEVVKGHEKKLETIDSMLIPSADNEELKALLTATRPIVVAHLEHAKELQSKM